MAFRGRRFRTREESPVLRLRPDFESRNSVSPEYRGRGRSPEFRSHEEGSRLREREERRRMRWEDERHGRSRSRNRFDFRERRSRSGGRRSRSVERYRFEPPDRPFEDEFEPRRRSLSMERRSRERHLSPKWVEDMRNKYSPPRLELSQFPTSAMQEPVTLNMPQGMLNQMQPNGPIETSTPIISNKGYAQNQNFGPPQRLIQPVLDKPILNQGFPQGSGFSDGPNIIDSQDLSEGGGPVIPEFNPETSKLSSYEWIKLIEETAKQRDWRKDERHYIMTSRLAGFARQWYLTTGINYKNWGDIRRAFLQVFPTEGDYQVLLEKMMARKKEENESMTTYFQHKVALLNACDIHGRRAVSCIIGGLQNPELKLQSKRENFEDPDALYAYLRSRNDEPATSKVKNQKVAEDSKNKKFCHGCKQSGHLIAQCPNSQKCTVCKGFGHQCAQPNNKVMCGPLARIPTHDQHFTEACIKGKVLKAYVDVSSEVTTIREENARFLKLPIRRMYKMIKGFGGVSISSFGFTNVALSIDRAIASLPIYVVSNHIQSIPLVVGQSFTEQPHVVVMQDEHKMCFYQRMDNGQTNFST